jgi:hypothetical protein
MLAKIHGLHFISPLDLCEKVLVHAESQIPGQERPMDII